MKPNTIVTTAVYPEQAETADFNWCARFSWHSEDDELRGDGETEAASVSDLLTNSYLKCDDDGDTVFEHIADMALQHWVSTQAKPSVADAALDVMRITLRNLSCDVEGLKAFEYGVRQAIGNTNWTVLMEFNDRARAIAKEGK